MARQGWIYHADGTVTEKGTGVTTDANGQRVYFAGDLPDFKSPIDGKVYSGRAGLREHNRLHNVVNNEELTGLPYKTMNSEYKPDRKQIREQMLETIHRKGYM